MLTMPRPSQNDKTILLWLLAGLRVLGCSAAEPQAAPEELPRIAPTEAHEALETFELVPGYRLELVAAEPLVADPIAMAFDGRRRLFVVEMRGYSERRDEKLGRIRHLVDDDGDGRFDRSTVYAERLAWPTAVIAWRGGIFVAATPDLLYLKDDDGDGVADSRTRIFTGFGAGVDRLNVQALVNNLKWGPDGRIHGATAGNGGSVRRPGKEKGRVTELRGLDFSFDPLTLDFRAENGGGQYGLCFDTAGRKFVCSNSNHIQQIMFARRYAGPPLKNPRVGIASDGPAAEVFRLSGDEPWRIVRTRWRVAGKVGGPVEGGGRVSGYFTAATGIEIHQGDAFICDAGSNLVHRKALRRVDGKVQLEAVRPEAEQGREFLASTDNWFRPVQTVSGPDGALYIADMYREVIEHPWSLPESIKKHLDLNRGNDRGRIYRIVRDGFVQAPPEELGRLSDADLVSRLGRADYGLALDILRQRPAPGVVRLLGQCLASDAPAPAKIQALQLLSDIGAIDEAVLVEALGGSEAGLRLRAISLCEPPRPIGGRLRAALTALANDQDPEIRYQLALTLGLRQEEWRIPILADLLAEPVDRWIQAAAIKALGSSAATSFGNFARDPSRSTPGSLIALAKIVGRTGTPEEIARIRALVAPPSGHRFQILRALAMGNPSAAWVESLAGTAAEVLGDRSAPVAERVAAIQLMGMVAGEEPSLFRQLLADSKETTILDAIAEEEFRWDERESAIAMVERWDDFSQPGKRQTTRAMLGPGRAPILLNAIERGDIPIHALDGTTVDRLRNHPTAELRALAGDLFDDSSSPRTRIEQFAAALDLAGDPLRGGEIFKSRCLICHRTSTQGFAYGPDVASFRSAGKQSVLTNLIDPNREIAPQFLAHELVLLNGSRPAGRIIFQDDQQIGLSLPAGIEQQIPRHQITSIIPLPNSPMPEHLEAGLDQQQMADLLEFLCGSNRQQ